MKSEVLITVLTKSHRIRPLDISCPYYVSYGLSPAVSLSVLMSPVLGLCSSSLLWLCSVRTGALSAGSLSLPETFSTSSNSHPWHAHMNSNLMLNFKILSCSGRRPEFCSQHLCQKTHNCFEFQLLGPSQVPAPMHTYPHTHNYK